MQKDHFRDLLTDRMLKLVEQQELEQELQQEVELQQVEGVEQVVMAEVVVQQEDGWHLVPVD